MSTRHKGEKCLYKMPFRDHPRPEASKSVGGSRTTNERVAEGVKNCKTPMKLGVRSPGEGDSIRRFEIIITVVN